LIKKSGLSNLSVVFYDLNSKHTDFEYNQDLALKPASVLKLIITALSLQKLGPDYVFETPILGEPVGDTVPVLEIKGSGDPSFTIETLWSVARGLKERGVNHVGKILLDNSLFLEPKTKSGQRAYESEPSALAFNFDSVGVVICPTQLGKPAHLSFTPFELPAKLSGKIITSSGSSAEVSVDEVSADPQALSYAVKGSIGVQAECKTIYRSVSNPPAYFGQVFLAILRELGISAPKALNFGKVNSEAKTIFTNRSKALSLILQDMNHFSTNFIAEQLLYALSDERDGRLSREAGLAALSSYLVSLGFRESDFKLLDASGLDHGNRVSSRMVVRVMEDLLSQETLRPEFEASLSVAGRSGTLKKRDFEIAELTIRGKTGSLDGVSSLAGLIPIPKLKKRIAFAILINDAASKDIAVKLEDKLVQTFIRSIAGQLPSLVG